MDVKTPRQVPIIPNNVFPGKLNPELVLAGLSKETEAARTRAWKKALETPFPHTKDEDWRWLDFSDFDSNFFNEQSSAVHAGICNEEQELPAGVCLYSFADFEHQYAERLLEFEKTFALNWQDRFAWTTRALADGGMVLCIDPKVQLGEAIHLTVNAAGNGSSFSNTWIWMGEGSTARVVLRFNSRDKGSALHGALVQVALGEAAQLELDEVQMLNQKSWLISHEQARLAKDASLHWNYVALGTKKSKVFLNTDLENAGADARLKGIYFAGSGQHLNLDTQQNHLAPHTSSDLAFRGAAGGKGKTTWEGMILVNEIAQGTDAYQSDRNLILSQNADMDAIPGLEICANDVSCSHGATVGRIDEEELYYLQCRGIPAEEGERLIVEGFFAELIDAIHDDATKKIIISEIDRKFLYKDMG